MFAVSRVIIKKHVGVRFSSFYSGENLFSEENIKRTASKFSSLKPIRMHTHQPPKRAAVLIPLCEIDGKVSLLYTLRAAHLKSHRGQVSFPGGMQDINDKTLEETALRETNEELGIEPSKIELWGSGNLIVTKGETSVLPVVGRIHDNLNMERLNINPTEVEEVFAVSLEDLCDPNKLGYTQFKAGYSMPVFTGGKWRIWGLTALMTHMFLNSLLPGKAYSHRIKYMHSVNSKKKSAISEFS